MNNKLIIGICAVLVLAVLVLSVIYLVNNPDEFDYLFEDEGSNDLAKSKRATIFSKDYDEVDKEVTVTRTVGGAELVKIKLLTPLDNKVMMGINRTVIMLEVTPLVELPAQRFLESLETYNINDGMNSVEKKVHWQVRKKVDEQTRMHWIRECEDIGLHPNGSVNTECELVNTHNTTEDIYEWKDKDTSKLETIPVKTFVIRGIVDVGVGESTEWIPNFLGNDTVESIRVEEWASWSEALSDGLLFYYNFESGYVNTTTVLDVVDNYGDVDGVYKTPAGITEAAEGIIGDGVNFSGADDVWISTLSEVPQIAQGFSVNFWAFATETSNPLALAGRMSEDGLEDRDFRIWYGQGDSNPGDNYEFYCAETGCSTIINGNPRRDNVWTMITFKSNATGIYLYENGTLTASSISSYNIATNANFSLSWECGPFGANCQEFEGTMDEVSYYNRSLSDSEISDLWNSGAGLTYPLNVTPTGEGPNITIIYPIDGISYLYNVSTINYSTTPADACWYSIDGGTTNSTPDENCGNFTGVRSYEGDNNWTVYANDTAGGIGSTTVTFRQNEIPDNVSILANSNKPENFLFASAAYVESDLIVFNTSAQNTNVSIITVFNVEKVSHPSTNQIYSRITLDGTEILVDEVVRTVSEIGEAGATGNAMILKEVSAGEHNLSIEWARTNSGIIQISNYEMVLIEGFDNFDKVSEPGNDSGIIDWLTTDPDTYNVTTIQLTKPTNTSTNQKMS